MSTLELDPRQITEWSRLTHTFVRSWYTRPPNRSPDEGTSLMRRQALQAPPDELPTEMSLLLKVFADAAATGVDTSRPDHLAHVPGYGLFASALGEYAALVTHQYTTVAAMSPDMVALENGVLSWMCTQTGWAAPAGGLVTTGSSLAILAALVAARHHHLGEDIARGVWYASEHTHDCVAKAARIIGLPADAARTVPTTADLRIDVDAAREMIHTDRGRGRQPFLLVANAGSTDAGIIDPLADVGQLGHEEGLTVLADAALGWGFLLTQRGRDRLHGIHTADMVSLDAHKSLAMSYRTGVLLARDLALLRNAHATHGPYREHLPALDDLPDFAALGPELTREPRGPRLWFALHAHGLHAFRSALEEKLDLAALAHAELAQDSLLEAPWQPELCTVVARVRGEDSLTDQLVRRINHDHGLILSTTRIRGRLYLRLCILLPTTHRPQVERVLGLIHRAARAL